MALVARYDAMLLTLKQSLAQTDIAKFTQLLEHLTMLTSDRAFLSCSDLGSLFHSISHYMGFLNPYLLDRLAQHDLLARNSKLISAYVNKLGETVDDMSLSDLKGIYPSILSQLPAGLRPITLKMTSIWTERSFKQLVHVTFQLFGVCSKLLLGPLVSVRADAVFVKLFAAKCLVPVLKGSPHIKINCRRNDITEVKIGEKVVFPTDAIHKVVIFTSTACFSHIFVNKHTCSHMPIVGILKQRMYVFNYIVVSFYRYHDCQFF